MVVHLFVGQETSIVWFGSVVKQVGATWKSLNYYRTATYYQTATDGLFIVWFQLCGTCDKFHNLWTKCLVEEIMTSLPILFSIHWQSHIVHDSGKIEICIILFDGGRGLKCLLVVVVESSSHLKKVGSPHSMVWRFAFEPTNGWIFDPDKRNDRMHQVEIRIINRFFENLTAPPCLMGAQSLMTKQRFFILRDPQQIRYLHKKFKTRSGTMIFCCLW